MRVLATVLCLPLLVAASAPAQSTATTVSASPTTAIARTPITLSARVTGASANTISPSGNVTFYDGSSSLGSANLVSAAIAAPKVVPASQLFGTVGVSKGTLVTADLNGDGKLDVVTYGSTTFQTLLNNGNGTYSAASVQNYALSQPAFLDYDHDGKVDIVTLTGNALYLLKGNGAGSFSAPVALTGFSTIGAPQTPGGPLTNFGSTAVAAVNLRGTGLLDLVVGEVIPATPTPDNTFVVNQAALSTYRNNGDGTFTLISTTPTGDMELQGYPSEVTAIQSASVTADGNAGVIITTHATVPNGSTAVRLMPGFGDGTLHAPSATIASGSCKTVCPVSTALGNFTASGYTDVAVTVDMDSPAPTYSVVLPGKGDGTFATAIPFTVIPGNSAAMVALDLDGDGKTDLLDAQGYGYLNKGNATFSQTANLVGSSVTSPMLAADFNGDGLIDVYFTNSSTGSAPVVLLGQRSSAASLPVITTLSAGTHSIKAVYAGSGSYAGSTSSPVTVTITAQVPTISGSASPSVALVTQPVTFSVKVTSSAATPTGKVTFAQGGATLGTATLNSSGVASFAYTFSSAGTQAVTASYSGDSATAPASVTITASTAAAFSTEPTDGNTSLTSSLGGIATVELLAKSQNGFSGTVGFTCTGLPAGTQCSFKPSSVAVSPGTPGSTSLRVTTSASYGAGLGGTPFTRSGGIACAGILMGCLGLASRRKRIAAIPLFLVGMTVLLGGLSGCGSGVSSSISAPRSFSVVTISGNARSTTTFAIKIQ